MLYDSLEHEKLIDCDWDSEVAIRTISEIAAEAESAFLQGSFWPYHPFDADWKSEGPALSLYWGASSTAWSLMTLEELRRIKPLSRDYRQIVREAYLTYLSVPDTGEVAPGYLFGEAGILTALYRFSPSQELESKLFERVRQSIERAENELMWAAPGGMVSAIFMQRQTGHDQWKDLISEGAKKLLDSWESDLVRAYRIWVQDLYGKRKRYLGAVHGFAGNVYALLRAFDFLDETQRRFILEESARTLIQTALKSDDGANWRPSIEPDFATLMVQWCHGAPGMVTAFSEYPQNVNPEVDALLVQAGELIWKAGPLQAPFGLCHGTAGNGYAFLKLYQRMGEERWLDRARRFAMHAIHQSEQQRMKFGFRRFSLFTGDLGLAMYLSSCLEGDARWPLLERV